MQKIILIKLSAIIGYSWYQMHVANTLKQLLQITFNHGFSELNALVINDPGQIMVHVWKHVVSFRAFFRRRFLLDHINKLDNIRVVDGF